MEPEDLIREIENLKAQYDADSAKCAELSANRIGGNLLQNARDICHISRNRWRIAKLHLRKMFPQNPPTITKTEENPYATPEYNPENDENDENYQV